MQISLGVAVADDDIAIGEGIWIRIGHRGGAGRCLLLSGVAQTSHFNGVRTVFGPNADIRDVITEAFVRGSTPARSMKSFSASKRHNVGPAVSTA